MKLIIDIPEEVYKNPHNYCCYSLANEFKKGIPLEDIKAEIEKQNIADFIAVQSVLDIIDKHIGGEENEE